MQINQERLHQSIAELKKIGATPEGGISRLAGTQAELQARQWLLQTSIARGLTAKEDAAGNIIIQIGPSHGASVVTGSHLDSVPNGGYLDGALGVLCGLEAMTVLNELNIPLKRPLEVIAFFDEEGRFGSMIGSKALAGKLSIDDLKNAKNEQDKSLEDFLHARNSSIDAVLELRRTQEDLYAFIELHIEQGPVLEANRHSIGIVEHITGIIRWRARFDGEANHAGTTPMSIRRDAFQGVVQFGQVLTKICQEHGADTTRYTIGRVVLKPNYVGVIPQIAEFTLDLRDVSKDRLSGLNQRLIDAAQSIAQTLNLTFTVDVHGQHQPTTCNARLSDLIETSAQAHDYTNMRMLSGALHDAASMAHLGPVGMIFVPSTGGVSHSTKEFTEPIEIERGAQVLLDCLHTLSTESKWNELSGTESI